MKRVLVVFHKDFYQVYTSDPAAEAGRMEASSYSSWGFCYFNNMAIALLALHEEGLMSTALVLDIDLHFGDGTVDILGDKDWVKIHNPSERSREEYVQQVGHILSSVELNALRANLKNL